MGFLGAICSRCGYEFAVDFPGGPCAVCQSADRIELLYDYNKLRESISSVPEERLACPHVTLGRPYGSLVVGDYADIRLPIGIRHLITPLRPLSRLRPMPAGGVWLKDEGVNPTASVKDRLAEFAVLQALRSGTRSITLASSGNGAAAVSSLCAASGLDAYIFVPRSSPAAKLQQCAAFGARLQLVDGGYDHAYQASVEWAIERSLYCCNTGYNSYPAEALKLVFHEAADQLSQATGSLETEFSHVFVPVGDGTLLSAAHRAFTERFELGWQRGMPRLVGVQSQASDYLTKCWQEGVDKRGAVEGQGIASGITVAVARDAWKALRAVRETGGCMHSASDDDIMECGHQLAKREGIFLEPSGAVALTGCWQLAEHGTHSLVVGSGSGLKDTSWLQSSNSVGQLD